MSVRPSVQVYKRAEKSREESSSENQLRSLYVRICSVSLSRHEGKWVTWSTFSSLSQGIVGEEETSSVGRRSTCPRQFPLFQCFVFLTIVGIAAAYPAADHGGLHDASPYIDTKYAPKGKYSPAPYKEKDLPPQPYQFEYGVADQYTGAHFQASETQDAGGNVLGRFVFSVTVRNLEPFS